VFVTRFEGRSDFLDQGQAGRRETVLEDWIPAEDLPAFNRKIVGLLKVVSGYR